MSAWSSPCAHNALQGLLQQPCQQKIHTCLHFTVLWTLPSEAQDISQETATVKARSQSERVIMEGKLEYSRPVFCLIGAALFVATVPPIIALATPDWLLIGYKTQSFMGVVIDVTVRMGLLQQLTTSGSLTQKDATMWCGDGSTTDPSPWCHQVEGVKAMSIIAIVLGSLSLLAMTGTLGKPPRKVAIACSIASTIAAISVWIASGLWGQVKDGYCSELATGYVSRTCTYGSSFVETTGSGFFFLIAASALAIGKTVSGAASWMDHIV